MDDMKTGNTFSPTFYPMLRKTRGDWEAKCTHVDFQWVEVLAKMFISLAL